MNVCDEHISIDREMRDRRQWDTVFVLFHLFLKSHISCIQKRGYLVDEDLELRVVSADSDVYVIAALPRVALSLFLAPLSLRERVEHELKTKLMKS